jgi:hypothetical protein
MDMRGPAAASKTRCSRRRGTGSHSVRGVLCATWRREEGNNERGGENERAHVRFSSFDAAPGQRLKRRIKQNEPRAATGGSRAAEAAGKVKV